MLTEQQIKEEMFGSLPEEAVDALFNEEPLLVKNINTLLDRELSRNVDFFVSSAEAEPIEIQSIPCTKYTPDLDLGTILVVEKNKVTSEVIYDNLIEVPELQPILMDNVLIDYIDILEIERELLKAFGSGNASFNLLLAQKVYPEFFNKELNTLYTQKYVLFYNLY